MSSGASSKVISLLLPSVLTTETRDLPLMVEPFVRADNCSGATSARRFNDCEQLLLSDWSCVRFRDVVLRPLLLFLETFDWSPTGNARRSG